MKIKFFREENDDAKYIHITTTELQQL